MKLGAGSSVEWDGGGLAVTECDGRLAARGWHVFKGLREVALGDKLDLGELSGGAVKGTCIPTQCEVDGDANETRMEFVGTGKIART